MARARPLRAGLGPTTTRPVKNFAQLRLNSICHSLISRSAISLPFGTDQMYASFMRIFRSCAPQEAFFPLLEAGGSWIPTSFEVQDYLDFLGCSNLRTPSLSSLTAIHKAHICKIPFNNLCTVQGNKNVRSMGFTPSVPSLDVDAIFAKMVQQRKGGYCFEHSGLMLALLQSLAYKVYAAGANVALENSEAAASGQIDLKGCSHEVLIVRRPEDGRWRLLDAGFGGNTPTQPLVLQHPADDNFTGDTFFRVRRGMLGRVAQPSQEEVERESHACGWYMQRYSETEQEWQDQYFFREVENPPGDFEVMNWVVATNPAKGFYHTLRMGIQQLDGGKVTVMDDILRVHKSSGDVEEQKLDIS